MAQTGHRVLRRVDNSTLHKRAKTGKGLAVRIDCRDCRSAVLGRRKCEIGGRVEQTSCWLGNAANTGSHRVPSERRVRPTGGRRESLVGTAECPVGIAGHRSGRHTSAQPHLVVQEEQIPCDVLGGEGRWQQETVSVPYREQGSSHDLREDGHPAR